MKRNTLLASALLMATAPLSADTGMLHGTVVLEDGREISGAIRWDDEDVFWNDLMHGDKAKATDISGLTEDEQESILDLQPGPTMNFNGHTVEFIKLFGGDEIEPQGLILEYGSIAEIEPDGRRYAKVTLRDGTRLEAADIETNIEVKSSDGTRHDIDWDDVERVRFSSGAADPTAFDHYLYGTVKTELGEFTGVVQWDIDERTWPEKLDGDVDGNDVSIEFGQIRSIARDGDGSLVESKDGTTNRLTGTNDVDESNRGLRLWDPAVGRIQIPWEVFLSVTFTDEVPADLTGYGTFEAVGPLRGTVETRDGDTLEGEITYDLDEHSSAEFLTGRTDEDVIYNIPLRVVRSIRPGDDFSEVELTNGNKLTLKGNRDVNSRNNGLMVDSGVEKPNYLTWGEVALIRFSR